MDMIRICIILMAITNTWFLGRTLISLLKDRKKFKEKEKVFDELDSAIEELKEPSIQASEDFQ